MSVIVPWDRAYRRARKAKQGRERLPPRFDNFVDDFRTKFGVAPLWLETDHLDHTREAIPKPRLEVIIERTADYQRFLTAPYNFDSRRQKVVAKMFAEHFTRSAMRSLFKLPRRLPADYDFAQRIFVAFSDFEPVAIQDVHRSVSKADLASFEASLGLGDDFWCTQSSFGPPIVFVYTEEQAKALNASDLPNGWADTYFSLAKKHDEFDYLAREEFFIAVDSKENFDSNYSSNWYYYFK